MSKGAQEKIQFRNIELKATKTSGDTKQTPNLGLKKAFERVYDLQSQHLAAITNQRYSSLTNKKSESVVLNPSESQSLYGNTLVTKSTSLAPTSMEESRMPRASFDRSSDSGTLVQSPDVRIKPHQGGQFLVLRLQQEQKQNQQQSLSNVTIKKHQSHKGLGSVAHLSE